MIATLETEPLKIPIGIVDLASFRRWTLSDDFPESGKIDYLAGTIEVDMSPSNVWRHSGLKSSLAGELFNITKGRGQIFVDQTRVVSPLADLSREPDIVFLSWESLKSGRVVLCPSAKPRDQFDLMELEGGPDLISEVVSPSSVTKDTKRRVEARAPPVYASISRRPFGVGTGVPISLAVSIQRSIASFTFCNAESCVFPCAMQPGNSGTSPMKTLSSFDQYKIISYLCFIASPQFVLQQHHSNLANLILFCFVAIALQVNSFFNTRFEINVMASFNPLREP